MSKFLKTLCALNPYRRARQLAWRTSMLGLARGERITRYAMYQRLRTVGGCLPFRSGKALSVSHSGKLLDVLGFEATELVEANYPDHSFVDLRFPDDTFDCVVSDMVLAHVVGNPQDAVNESRRVLRKGGIAVHTSIFMYPINRWPTDLWRFSPDALQWLHRGFSRIIEVGGWGNPYVWEVLKDGMFSQGVPHAKWHPYHRIAMRNDPERPSCVWIIAEK